MEDVEPKVQRHVNTQLENSRLVCILSWSREWDKVMLNSEISKLNIY